MRRIFILLVFVVFSSVSFAALKVSESTCGDCSGIFCSERQCGLLGDCEIQGRLWWKECVPVDNSNNVEIQATQDSSTDNSYVQFIECEDGDKKVFNDGICDYETECIEGEWSNIISKVDGDCGAESTVYLKPKYPGRVATYQENCFDKEGNVVGCDGTFQEGDYADLRPKLPKPRFKINGDGTVTDLHTGLVWLQSISFCDYFMNHPAWRSGAGLNLTIAMELVSNLEDGKCNLEDGSKPGDWRIPSLHELLSLRNYDYQYAISNTYGDGKIERGDPFYGRRDNPNPSTEFNLYGELSNTMNRWSYSYYYSFIHPGYGGLVKTHTTYYKEFVWPVRNADDIDDFVEVDE